MLHRFLGLARTPSSAIIWKSALRKAHLSLDLPTAVFESSMVTDIINGIKKHRIQPSAVVIGLPSSVLNFILRGPILSEQEKEAAAFSFIFFFRINETLQLAAAREGDTRLTKMQGRDSSVFLSSAISGEEVLVVLHRTRKRSLNTVTERGCCCHKSSPTHCWWSFCPIHHFGRRLKGMSPGEKFFPRVSYQNLLLKLKLAVKPLVASQELEDQFRVGTHSLRKGAMRTLQKEGTDLGQALAAENWHSMAILRYISMEAEKEKALESAARNEIFACEGSDSD